MTPSEEIQNEIQDLVDQAFEILSTGDIGAADRFVQDHLSHHRNSEVLFLMGCIASERGDFEEAIKKCQEALDIDPGYVPAFLNIAEIQLEAWEDPVACLDTCDRVFPLTEDVPEARMEVLCVRAQALQWLDRDEEAVEALRATKGLEVSEPDTLNRVGQVALDLDTWDIAELAFAAALRIDPEDADAHYGMGMVCQERGNEEAMAHHWTRTLELDAQAPPPSWSLSLAEVKAAAEAALQELPSQVRSRLDNVQIFVEEAPSVQDVADGLEPRVLGVFRGLSLPERSALDGVPVEPNVISLYKRNLEASCSSPDEFWEEIRLTVLHETAHFFGLDDEVLTQMGLD